MVPNLWFKLVGTIKPFHWITKFSKISRNPHPTRFALLQPANIHKQQSLKKNYQTPPVTGRALESLMSLPQPQWRAFSRLFKITFYNVTAAVGRDSQTLSYLRYYFSVFWPTFNTSSIFFLHANFLSSV